jgi:hypothetical protein
MSIIRIFSLVVAAFLLALASCDSTPLETEPEAEAELTGYLLHLEVHPFNPDEGDIETMWILYPNDYVSSAAELHRENPQMRAYMSGPVHPQPGVDPRWQFHFDPEDTSFWPTGQPVDDRVFRGTLRELEERVLSGELTLVELNRIRVLEVVPASEEPEI